jgi:hypothetical protein
MMTVWQIKAKKGVRLEQMLKCVLRIEAGDPQIGVNSALGLSGPTAKYL